MEFRVGVRKWIIEKYENNIASARNINLQNLKRLKYKPASFYNFY
jgi:hypothetical protein